MVSVLSTEWRAISDARSEKSAACRQKGSGPGSLANGCHLARRRRKNLGIDPPAAPAWRRRGGPLNRCRIQAIAYPASPSGDQADLVRIGDILIPRSRPTHRRSTRSRSNQPPSTSSRITPCRLSEAADDRAAGSTAGEPVPRILNLNADSIRLFSLPTRMQPDR